MMLVTTAMEIRVRQERYQGTKTLLMAATALATCADTAVTGHPAVRGDITELTLVYL